MANTNMESNYQYIYSIIKCLEVCGRQGISLRGHRDDETSDSANKGNFKALIDIRIDAGDTILEERLKNGPGNATYISKTSQNNLTECIGEYINGAIVMSNWEQLGIAIRYIKHNQAVERILEYVGCEATTGKFICRKILECLVTAGLHPNRCQAQTNLLETQIIGIMILTISLTGHLHINS